MSPLCDVDDGVTEESMALVESWHLTTVAPLILNESPESAATVRTDIARATTPSGSYP
jgi:hypothetical protein